VCIIFIQSRLLLPSFLCQWIFNKPDLTVTRGSNQGIFSWNYIAISNPIVLCIKKSIKDVYCLESVDIVKVIDVTKEKKGDIRIVILHFHSIQQLFDDSDTAPLPDKELTERAEETIASYLDEIWVRRQVELEIVIPKKEILSLDKELVSQTIKNHFLKRIPQLNHELILKKREGIFSFQITLINAIIGFLFILLTDNGYLNINPVIYQFIGFFIMIANWASMWKTYEFYFYDYRNLSRKRKVYKKISQMDIVVTMDSR